MDCGQRVVLSNRDRYNPVMGVANQPTLRPLAAHIKQRMRDKLKQHTKYIPRSAKTGRK
ncbi:MAG TPA: hypothetical protein VN639_14580 [Azonexus sp.]|nr:hypothetical protein [Azonexus sp.]